MSCGNGKLMQPSSLETRVDSEVICKFSPPSTLVHFLSGYATGLLKTVSQLKFHAAQMEKNELLA